MSHSVISLWKHHGPNTLFTAHGTPKSYQKRGKNVYMETTAKHDWRLKQYFSITTVKQNPYCYFALFHRNSMAWIHSFILVCSRTKQDGRVQNPETIWKRRYCCRNTNTLVRVLHLSPRKWFTLFINIGFGEGQEEQERVGARVWIKSTW